MNKEKHIHEDGCSCNEHHEHHNHEKHDHDHNECGCGHNHSHEEHEDEDCDCDHEHESDACSIEDKHSHHHGDNCGCGHDHSHKHEEDSCGCGHDHSHDHEDSCGCGHDHEHVERSHSNTKGKYTYQLSGLDCANCAAKIENKLNNTKEFSDVQLVYMNQKVTLNSTYPKAKIKDELQKVVSRIEDGVIVLEMDDENIEEEKPNFMLARLIVGLVSFAVGMIFKDNTTLSLSTLALSYIIVGYDVLWRAIKNIIKGQIFDENFLMSIATIGAIYIGEYAEACAVMLFYQVGEYFNDRAVEKSRKSIGNLMDLKSEVAHLISGNSKKDVDPLTLQVGDIIEVLAGEKIPVDGIVIDGKSNIDAKALTGESTYSQKEVDDEVFGGMICVDGVLQIKVTKNYSDSTVAKILDLVENASSNKAPAESFITKFAKVYTPIVCALALAIWILPPLFIDGATFNEYLYRACTFLVISCPCALVISVPLTYFAGIGGLSKHGVLAKGGNYLEALNQVDTVVFDKTGTLTKGNFVVEKIESENKDETLKLAALAEQYSNHPIAQSIVAAYGKDITEKLEEVKEVAGRGIEGKYQGKQLLVGNAKLLLESNIEVKEVDMIGTLIYVAYDNKVSGVISIGDEIKDDSKDTVNELHKLNKQVVMLTGDHNKVADVVKKELNIDTVYSELLPQNKVEIIQKMIDEGKQIAFVGDGINDAPALALSKVGIAMGSLGADAAIEAADLVIMNDNPSQVLTAFKGAKKTHNIMMVNIIGALLVKGVILVLGALGIAGMWAAVFADVGVAMLAIINAISALNIKR